MKYIRTKDGIVGICSHEDNKNVRIKYHDNLGNHCPLFSKDDVLKQADTIKELCDCFSYETETVRDFLVARSWKRAMPERHIYGCIKTDKGLIYVAKMNDKGELELL